MDVRYGDASCVMGHGSKLVGIGAANRIAAGWLVGSDVYHVQDVELAALSNGSGKRSSAENRSSATSAKGKGRGGHNRTGLEKRRTTKLLKFTTVVEKRLREAVESRMGLRTMLQDAMKHISDAQFERRAFVAETLWP